MVDLIIRLAINAVALVVAVALVPRIRFDYGDAWWKLVAVAAIFGLINAYIRPIVSLLSLPLTIVTLGLAALVVNMAMLLLLALVSAQLDLGLSIAGWPGGNFDAAVIIHAFAAAVIISVVSTVLGLVRRIVPGI